MKTIGFISAALGSSCFLICSVGVAESHHKHQKAHSHGEAKLSIVIDGLKGKAEFESPAESVYGFEHEAKSDKDKKAKEDALNKLKANFLALLGIPADAGCKATKTEVESDHHDHDKKKGDEEHSDVEVELDFECTTSLAGKTLSTTLVKEFPRLRKVKVQVVAGDKQSSAELTAKKTSIQL